MISSEADQPMRPSGFLSISTPLFELIAWSIASSNDHVPRRWIGAYQL